jgi:hypothetical protein
MQRPRVAGGPFDALISQSGVTSFGYPVSRRSLNSCNRAQRLRGGTHNPGSTGPDECVSAVRARRGPFRQRLIFGFRWLASTCGEASEALSRQ